MHTFSLKIACLLWVALMLPVSAGQAQPSAVVQGRVVDAAGAPLAAANVQVKGTTEGAATGADGRFVFSTTRTGSQTVRATMLGYRPATQTIQLPAGDTTRVRLVLRKEHVELEEAVVTARAFTSGSADEVTLRPIEVVTTPGAAADIFRAMQTFPGVAQAREGAGLFVRGGDVSETVTLLDQATVHHPYKYESPTGGAFGTIRPFLVQGTHFSTGGFSAQYGNALSGVLAMESQDLPRQSRQYLNLGLAAASLGADVPLSDEFGLRFSGNRSFTGLLFAVNGRRDEFTLVPQGYDGNLSLIYRYSSTGQLKLFNYANTHRIGVREEEPSFSGIYRSRATNRLHNLQWTDHLRGWHVEASASMSRYGAHREFGNLDLRPADRTYKLRMDADRELGTGWRLKVGAETERLDNTFEGRIPRRPHVRDPDAATLQVDEQAAATRTGGYAEVEMQPIPQIVATAGLRSDYHSQAQQAVLDPRLSLQYLFSEQTRARLAWGRYHQFPAPDEYAPEQGNPDLTAQHAQHVVGGLMHERELLSLRAEAYYKPYRDLVLRHPEQNYANAGDGWARGVDLFAKYGEYLRTRLSGWASYSFLQTRRRQVRDVGRRSVYEYGPAPFDVTHNLTLVGKLRLIGFLNVGFTYRYATGRPVTPVAEAVPVEDGAYYLPVEGSIGSERLPAFRRLDLQLSYYVPFGNQSNAVFYLALNNAFDRANVTGYTYSSDYSTRTPRRTNYRRSVYVGLSVTTHL